MASEKPNGSAINLKDLSSLSFSYTISKDNMKGQQARNAQLLKEFGQKNQTSSPSLRTGHSVKAQQPTEVKNKGSVLPISNVEEHGAESVAYEEEEETEEEDETEIEGTWDEYMRQQKRYLYTLRLEQHIRALHPALPADVVKSGVLSFEKATFKRSLGKEAYEIQVSDTSSCLEHIRKYVL